MDITPNPNKKYKCYVRCPICGKKLLCWNESTRRDYDDHRICLSIPCHLCIIQENVKNKQNTYDYERCDCNVVDFIKLALTQNVELNQLREELESLLINGKG